MAADNVIDSLLLEIASDVGGADASIERMSNALGRLALSVNMIDIRKLASLSSTFTELSGSAMDFSQAMENIDFSGLAGSKNALDSFISQKTIDMMNEYGISGKNTFNELKKALSDAVQEWDKLSALQSKGLDTSATEESLKAYEKAFDGMYNSINRSMSEMNAMPKKVDAFKDLVQYINALNRSGNKISVPFSSEFGADWNKMRSSLGQAFTSVKGGTDFEVFITQLNDELGNVIDTTHGAEAAFQDLYNKLRLGRGIVDDFNKALYSSGSSGGTFDEDGDIAKNLLQNVRDISKYKKDMSTIGEDTSVFRENSELGNLKSAVFEVTNAVKNKTKAFQEEGTVASASVKKEIESLSSMEGTIQRITSLLGGMSAQGASATGGITSATGIQELGQASAGIQQLATNLAALNGIQFDATGINAIANALGTLGRKTVTQATSNIPLLSKQLQELSIGIKGLAFDDFDNTGLTELAQSISKLGSVAAGRAASGNITNLSKALKEMMVTLSDAPKVSSNLIEMTQALGNLANAMGRTGNAAKATSSGFSLFPTSIGKAKKSFSGLAAALGKFYATYWLLLRGLSSFKKAIDISSDLTEVQNVVDNAFGDFASKVEELSSRSIQDFGMSELTTKQIAGRFQAMGMAMGFAQGKMSDMSIGLTKLAADMASFYNVSQEEVARSLQAVFSGETEPLRKYGLDLTQTTLKEYALKNGLDANISSMTQAQKTMLRYQYVMANTAIAQGDFARTSGRMCAA